MTLLDRLNEKLESIVRRFDSLSQAEVESLCYALKASREFFEKTMEAEYGEDIGEIMQQWDEAVGRELE